MLARRAEARGLGARLRPLGFGAAAFTSPSRAKAICWLAEPKLALAGEGCMLAGRAEARVGGRRLVGLGRLELPTSPLSGARSSHLSYRPNGNAIVKQYQA